MNAKTTYRTQNSSYLSQYTRELDDARTKTNGSLFDKSLMNCGGRGHPPQLSAEPTNTSGAPVSFYKRRHCALMRCERKPVLRIKMLS